MIIMEKSRFNEILHYVVDLFKELRDVNHSLSGNIQIERYTTETRRYVFVRCKINLMTNDDIINLTHILKSFHITDGELVHMIDVDRCSELD